MNDEAKLIDQAKLLINRLERLSADSLWAHRSSGYRGSLLKWVERFESYEGQNSTWNECNLAYLQSLIQTGFEMLENAAREYVE